MEVPTPKEVANVSVREQILETASTLFYRHGVHAVGVDLIIAQAGVAKSSLYRHFRTKDDLIAAYVQAEDEAFWERWEKTASDHADDPVAELTALLNWIGTKIAAPDFRGCPQLNVVAEFPDPAHPARRIATNHKNELRHRLTTLTTRLNVGDPSAVADQLWLLIDGAFTNYDLLSHGDPGVLLAAAAKAILLTNS